MSQRIRLDRKVISELCEALMEQVDFWHSQEVYQAMPPEARIDLLQLGVHAGQLINRLEAQNAAEQRQADSL